MHLIFNNMLIPGFVSICELLHTINLLVQLVRLSVKLNVSLAYQSLQCCHVVS